MIPIQAPALQQPAPAESPESLRLRFSRLYQEQKWSDLADAFEALTPVQRGSYLTDWVEVLERAKRWERLLQVCEAVLPQLDPAKQPTVVRDFQKRKLSALTKLSRPAETLGLCEALGDTDEPFFYVLGTDQARLARDWGAMERLAIKLQARKPEDPLVPGILGEALARQDRFKDAEPHLQKAVVLAPKDPDAWCNLGRCLNDRQAWGEAEAALAKALELNARHLEARYNRGRSLFELRRYREAADDFTAALALAPEDPVLKQNLRQAQRYLEAETRGKALPRPSPRQEAKLAN